MVRVQQLYTKTTDPNAFVIATIKDEGNVGVNFVISAEEADTYQQEFPESECSVISGCSEWATFHEALQQTFLKNSCSMKRDADRCMFEVPNLGTFCIAKQQSQTGRSKDVNSSIISGLMSFMKYCNSKDHDKMLKAAADTEKQTAVAQDNALLELRKMKQSLTGVKQEYEKMQRNLKRVAPPPDRSKEMHVIGGMVRNPLGDGVFCREIDVPVLQLLKSKIVYSRDEGGMKGSTEDQPAKGEEDPESSNQTLPDGEAVPLMPVEDYFNLTIELKANLRKESGAMQNLSNSGALASSASMSVTSNLGVKSVDVPPSIDNDSRLCTIFGLIEKLDQWDFNVFKLQEMMTGSFLHEGLADQPRGGSLFIVAYCMFHQHNLLRKCNINEQTLLNWISVIEAGYHPNPYHNSMHAADVLHVTNYVITRGGLVNSVQLTDDDMLAAIISATIHDYNHPGINNNFHVKAQSYLAILFNDKSVLENVHVSSAFELMKMKEFDIFANIDDERKRNIKETVTEMVLATDMILHAKILASFKRKVTDSTMLTKKEDVRLCLSMVMKLADISNCSRPHHLYINWCNHITDEFYLQGDRERSLGYTISPFMDRYAPTVAKGQTAFMNYIVVPLFECMSEYLPDIRFTVDCCISNKEYWEKGKSKQS